MQDFFCTFLNFFSPRAARKAKTPERPSLLGLELLANFDFYKYWRLLQKVKHFFGLFLAFFWPFFKPCKSVSAHFFQRHFQVQIFISPPVVENLGKSQALFATFFNFFSSAYHGLHVAAHLYSRLLCRFRANLLQQLGVLLPLCDKRAANEDGTPAATYGGERG